jgi:hypothetical protein
MSVKYNKRPQGGPSVHKIYQHLPLQNPQKFTQIWIFGLKTNHLATLVCGLPPVYFRQKVIFRFFFAKRRNQGKKIS